MCDFGDNEDRELFQLAKKYVDKGKKIDWDTVTRKMKRKRSEKQKLQDRFHTLKRTNGTDLNKFPKRFFKKNPPKRVSKKKRVESSTPLTLLVDTATKENSIPSLLSRTSAEKFVESTLSSAKKETSKHSDGASDLNDGRLSPPGVSELINFSNFIHPITSNDVFLDVGCSLGNVIAQMALQSDVRWSVGIEIRQDLYALGRFLIFKSQEQFPQLKKVTYILGDVSDAKVTQQTYIRSATILFSHNNLLSSDGNSCLERLICDLPHLHCVLLLAPFCQNHQESCSRKICSMWKLHKKLKVSASCPKTFMNLYIFERK